MTWRNESKRHGLAAKGIKTVQRIPLNSNQLPVQFGMIVPSTEYSKPISEKKFQARIEDERRWLSDLFGGDTSVNDFGGYYDDDGKYIKEKGSIVWSSTTKKKYNENLKILADRIKANRDKWKQYQVLYKVEGYDFIYPKSKEVDNDQDITSIPVT